MVRQLGLWADFQLHWEVWRNFLILLAAVFLLDATPLRAPFKWAETFYHEMSHGLTCLLTGGKISHIVIRLDGNGLCYYRGGLKSLVTFMGYTGAALWGGLLYMVGTMDAATARYWLIFELALLVVVFVLWVKITDWQTRLILVLIGGTYALGLLLPQSQVLPWFFQLVGLYVLCNAIKAPLALIDGRHVGDGADLQRIYWVIPEVVWVAGWFVFGLLVLLFCLSQTVPGVRWFLGW